MRAQTHGDAAVDVAVEAAAAVEVAVGATTMTVPSMPLSGTGMQTGNSLKSSKRLPMTLAPAAAQAAEDAWDRVWDADFMENKL